MDRVTRFNKEMRKSSLAFSAMQIKRASWIRSDSDSSLSGSDYSLAQSTVSLASYHPLQVYWYQRFVPTNRNKQVWCVKSWFYNDLKVKWIENKSFFNAMHAMHAMYVFFICSNLIRDYSELCKSCDVSWRWSGAGDQHFMLLRKGLKVECRTFLLAFFIFCKE